MADDAAHDFSTRVQSANGVSIVAERSMYFDYRGTWTGGHDVLGATSPASTFYFAEGTTRPDFDPYITIQNPGRPQANVAITYMRGDGKTTTAGVTVGSFSRYTVHPADILGVGDDPAHEFSTVVRCTNGQGIICERPMYFDYRGAWSGGSDTLGYAP